MPDGVGAVRELSARRAGAGRSAVGAALGPAYAHAEPVSEDPFYLALAAVTVAISCVIGTITAMKGKRAFLVGGFFVGLFWVVGSIRLAKPGSYWYERFYDETKRAEADARFGASPETLRSGA